MTLTVCTFQRSEKFDIEQGVMVDDDRLIIDMHGLPVTAPILDFWLHPHKGCMVVVPQSVVSRSLKTTT